MVPLVVKVVSWVRASSVLGCVVISGGNLVDFSSTGYGCCLMVAHVGCFRRRGVRLNLGVFCVSLCGIVA